MRNATFRAFLIVTAFLSFYTSYSVFAQPVIVIDSNIIGKYIGKESMYLVDSSHKMNLADVERSNAFLPGNANVLNLGGGDEYKWVKFRATNAIFSDKIILSLEYPTINEVWFYAVYPNGKTDSFYISGTAPIRKRPYPHQFFLFDFTLPRGDTATCFLKLHSNNEIMVPIKLGAAETISASISNIDLFSGLYFGIMIVMLLYNLFVYFSVKDKSYLVYVNYIFWVTLTQATLQGYSQRFIWTNSEWLTRNMINFTGAMVGIATIVFVQSFLNTRRNLKVFNVLLNIVIVGDCAGILFLLIGQPVISYHIIDASAGYGALCVIITAIILYRRKLRAAGFFLIAWTIFLLSVFVFVFMKNNQIPYNFLTTHSLQIGSAIEAILLSFALADSINVLKKEKEISQALALSTAQENERIIREQNVMLESKVAERTIELKASNDDLSKAMKELKEAETQLVESEKMASLGQLTAGIAHEINNPINFVTSNVKPLNRDVQMLLETIDTLEKIMVSDEPLEAKQKQIENFKQDIDFDYLKVEIDHLLKGIGEGASRTAEIVRGLRIFSRLDEDDLKKADINECLESTVVIANNLIGSNIEVVKNYGNIPLVECYAGKLNQVFLNIISNGVYAVHKKFGDQSGGKLTISTRNDGENLYITIADNGTGMDENTKKKLFEPFFTTKDVGEGTGLGLSIVYNTINKHNGSITVNSVLGEGSEFIIGIPILHKETQT